MDTHGDATLSTGESAPTGMTIDPVSSDPVPRWQWQTVPEGQGVPGVGLEPVGVARIGHRIYVLCQGERLYSLHCYDLDTGRWIPERDLLVEAGDHQGPSWRFSPAVFALNGWLLLVGGSNEFEGSPLYSDVWAYDPATRHWALVGDAPYPLYEVSVCVCGSKAFIFSGKYKSSSLLYRETYVTLSLSGGVAVWGDIRQFPKFKGFNRMTGLYCMDLGDWVLLQCENASMALRPSASGRDEWREWARPGRHHMIPDHVCRLNTHQWVSIQSMAGGSVTHPVEIISLPTPAVVSQISVRSLPDALSCTSVDIVHDEPDILALFALLFRLAHLYDARATQACLVVMSSMTEIYPDKNFLLMSGGNVKPLFESAKIFLLTLYGSKDVQTFTGPIPSNVMDTVSLAVSLCHDCWLPVIFYIMAHVTGAASKLTEATTDVSVQGCLHIVNTIVQGLCASTPPELWHPLIASSLSMKHPEGGNDGGENRLGGDGPLSKVLSCLTALSHGVQGVDALPLWMAPMQTYLDKAEESDPLGVVVGRASLSAWDSGVPTMPPRDAMDILRRDLGGGGWNDVSALMQSLLRMAVQFPVYIPVWTQMVSQLGGRGSIGEVDLSSVLIGTDSVHHALRLLYAAPPISRLQLHPDTPTHIVPYLHNAASRRSDVEARPPRDPYSEMGTVLQMPPQGVVGEGPSIVSLHPVWSDLDEFYCATGYPIGGGRCLMLVHEYEGNGNSVDYSMTCEWLVVQEESGEESDVLRRRHEVSLETETVNEGAPCLTHVRSSFMWMCGGALYVLLHRAESKGRTFVPCADPHLLYRVDTETLEWTPIPDINHPPVMCTTECEYVSLDGKLFLYGCMPIDAETGSVAEVTPHTSGTTLVFDPEALTWLRVQDSSPYMGCSVWRPVTCEAQGRAYFLFNPLLTERAPIDSSLYTVDEFGKCRPLGDTPSRDHVLVSPGMACLDNTIYMASPAAKHGGCTIPTVRLISFRFLFSFTPSPIALAFDTLTGEYTTCGKCPCVFEAVSDMMGFKTFQLSESTFLLYNSGSGMNLWVMRVDVEAHRRVQEKSVC
ncbi:hypothetical protein KIPB_003544 [Kipferlia bialata]|uniref:Uncharacterized protein n=1 Tax=Kipferlia bialata TaxID=797122 RepID=A0A9K3CSF9_9EUKA|nr:hypothetical protein KIPB_003544 [Kipferlia bialata]|eukprot:g3544.t1